MNNTKKITLEEAINIIGFLDSPTLYRMWEQNNWEDEVELGTFLTAWTEAVTESILFDMNHPDYFRKMANYHLENDGRLLPHLGDEDDYIYVGDKPFPIKDNYEGIENI